MHLLSLMNLLLLLRLISLGWHVTCADFQFRLKKKSAIGFCMIVAPKTPYCRMPSDL